MAALRRGLTCGTPTRSGNQISSVWQVEQDIGYDALLLDPAEVAAVATLPASMPVQSPNGRNLNPGEGWVELPSLIDLLLASFAAVARGSSKVSDARASLSLATGDGRRHR